MRIIERPELKAVLAGQYVIELNGGGRLMDLALGTPTYARLTGYAILAVTWQVFTPAQIQQIAIDGAAAGSFDEPANANG